MQSKFLTGSEARQAIRSGQWRENTAGLAPGFVQANLVILPQAFAFDFLRFCFLNPKPCPVLDVTDPGSFSPSPDWAAGADLRTDLPRYRVYERGRVAGRTRDDPGILAARFCFIPDWVQFYLRTGAGRRRDPDPAYRMRL